MGGDDLRADEVYQPVGGQDQQAEANPVDLEDALDEEDLDATLDSGYSPPERPWAAEDAELTAEEQRQGESLDERLAREVPDESADVDLANPTDLAAPTEGDDSIGDTSDTDGELVDGEVGAERSGRLVAADSAGLPDVEDDLTADDVGIDGAAASAEEAAMHIVDDPEWRQG